MRRLRTAVSPAISALGSPTTIRTVPGDGGESPSGRPTTRSSGTNLKFWFPELPGRGVRVVLTDEDAVGEGGPEVGGERIDPVGPSTPIGLRPVDDPELTDEGVVAERSYTR